MASKLPDDETILHGTRDWPHAPPHRLALKGTYFVTARTLRRERHFKDPERLTFVRDHLLHLAQRYGWQMEAWAVLANHYHFVAHSSPDQATAESLRSFLKHLHADVTRQVNRWDGVEGRQIWHNYRETLLTFPESYYARLNYTHQNAVHHGLVGRASDYEWCSASGFETTCTRAWVDTIGSFKYDKIALDDEDND
ncbi:MAG: transposase [Prosthecobacter sp.]|nr:transposase [Prosthecobacter sp.]